MAFCWLRNDVKNSSMIDMDLWPKCAKHFEKDWRIGQSWEDLSVFLTLASGGFVHDGISQSSARNLQNDVTDIFCSFADLLYMWWCPFESVFVCFLLAWGHVLRIFWFSATKDSLSAVLMKGILKQMGLASSSISCFFRLLLLNLQKKSSASYMPLCIHE